MATTIPRRAYAAMFGPTTDDRLRLADTDLVIEIESDHTIYGEEVKFFTTRSQYSRAMSSPASAVLPRASALNACGFASGPPPGTGAGRCRPFPSGT
jgi:hypothetical protein